MSLSLLLVSFLTIVELNCENLFDYRHDSLKQDIEFTPDGDRRWTRRKYWDKLNNTAKTIMSCGVEGKSYDLPDLVALCEVENDSVMHDLTKRSALRSAGYEYLMTDSPDERGIDVALLYAGSTFAPIRYWPLRVTPAEGMRPTRDILYVCGRILSGDTVHVFVVHAPSRYGGERLTRPHRMAVADRLNEAVDSLRSACASPMIIVMGDFNDASGGYMLARMTGNGLQDISCKATGSNGARGTYKYKGKWEGIDHIMTSDNLAGMLLSCRVNDATFLLEEDEKYGGVQPFRTYRGWTYRNAYSDHLPLVARFRFEEKDNNVK